MLAYDHPELFKNDSVDKQLVISFTGGSFTNNDIETESFEFNDPLCTDDQVEFGTCLASYITFSIGIDSVPMLDKVLTVTITPDGGDPVPLGQFKVWSDVPDADRTWRKITAYDAMADILNAELVDWYNTLYPTTTTTKTVKQIRDSLFTYLNITQETVSLINDSVVVPKTIDTTSLAGKDVIGCICQVNGVLGKIGRDGKFKYVELSVFGDTLYPAEDLYPADDLYPAENTNVTELGENGTYISAEFEDYVTDFIDKVQIRMEENDIGCIVGSGTNAMIIENNFLLFGKSSADLTPIATAIYNKVSGIYFKPMKALLVGNPLMEVGDGIRLWTRKAMIDTYILNRKMTGVQSLRDTYEAKSTQVRSEQLTDTHHELIMLMGKSNTLSRTLEETVSTVEHIIDPLDPTSLQSQITQNAQAITTKVAKGEVISTINQSAEQVTIDASKINLNGAVTANNNFKINLDGTMETTGATILGTVESRLMEGSPEYIAESASLEEGQVLLQDRIVTKRKYHDANGYYGEPTEWALVPTAYLTSEGLVFRHYTDLQLTQIYNYFDPPGGYNYYPLFDPEIYVEQKIISDSYYTTVPYPTINPRDEYSQLVIDPGRRLKLSVDDEELVSFEKTTYGDHTIPDTSYRDRREWKISTGIPYPFASLGEASISFRGYYSRYYDSDAGEYKNLVSSYGIIGPSNVDDWHLYGRVSSPSDRRVKKDIKPINEKIIDAIGKVELKQFIYTNRPPEESDKISLGAIAQEVMEALESEGLDYNDYGIIDGDERRWSLQYEHFLIARCAYLEKRLADLEERITKLEKGE